MSRYLKPLRRAAVLAVTAGSVAAFALPALAWDFNNPKDKDILCQYYANGATSDGKKNREMECGGTGNRWGEYSKGHYDWCMGQRGQSLIKSETEARQNLVKRCSRCNDYATTRNEFEAKWDSQLCGRIGDLRQMDRYRNTGITNHALLMYSCLSKPMTTSEMDAARAADNIAMYKCENFGSKNHQTVAPTGRFKPIKKLKINP